MIDNPATTVKTTLNCVAVDVKTPLNSRNSPIKAFVSGNATFASATTTSNIASTGAF